MGGQVLGSALVLPFVGLCSTSLVALLFCVGLGEFLNVADLNLGFSKMSATKGSTLSALM